MTYRHQEDRSWQEEEKNRKFSHRHHRNCRWCIEILDIFMIGRAQNQVHLIPLDDESKGDDRYYTLVSNKLNKLNK